MRITPKIKARGSVPILAPKPELIGPAGPLLDRLEALQRRHGIPEQNREEFRQQLDRHHEAASNSREEEAKICVTCLPNFLMSSRKER